MLTDGVAEGSAWVRSELVTSLGLLDVRLDHQRNREAAHDALLSQPGAPVAMLLIQAGENVELARGAAAVLPSSAARTWPFPRSERKVLAAQSPEPLPSPGPQVRMSA